MATKKQIREALSHYLTGLIVIVKGFDKSEHYHEHPVITILLFALGIFIIAATYFHHFFEKHVKDFRILMHFCEFVVVALIAVYYFSLGKKALPFCYSAAALGHLVAAYMFYRKKMRQTKRAAEV